MIIYHLNSLANAVSCDTKNRKTALTNRHGTK
jgi:hypothetical protein